MTFNGCKCPKKTTKEISSRWYKKQKKEKTRSLEYLNTKIWRKKRTRKRHSFQEAISFKNFQS